MIRLILIWLCALYVAAAFGFYRAHHPELTETQLLLNAKEAMLWR